MKAKKGKLFKIFSLLTAITIVIWANGGLSIDLNNTAQAVGDLTVDWGVTSEDPIFVVNNFAPGDTESRSVLVTNDGTSMRPVGVRGEPTSETGSLSTVLDFVISVVGTDLYGGTSSTGPKTLAQFFDESTDINGILLSFLAPSASTTYTFTATFAETAGNDFQNSQVIFDLIIGISVEVPAECEDIEFSGSPIFGTSGNDNLVGTPGNDLIFGFEGKDAISGVDGDDCIVGGEDDDKLKGNKGQDVILGGEGDDKIQGNNETDELFGGEGDDDIHGGNNNDILDGGTGNDKLDGGNRDDILLGGEGEDDLKGGNGDDQLFGGSQDDSLKGGNGDDYLDGGDGNDGLKGGNGTDTCLNGEEVETCELP